MAKKRYKSKKKSMAELIWGLVKLCMYFIPSLAFMVLYSTVQALPFVTIENGAIIFTIILFAAGILLTCKIWYGGLIGIGGCIFAFLHNWLISGKIEMGVMLICALSIIFFLFGIIDYFCKD